MWISKIPVISTVHLPGPYAYKSIPVFAISNDKEYIFAMIYSPATSDEEYENYPQWLKRIVEWARNRYCEGWIRFESMGDQVADLPRYDDMWI